MAREVTETHMDKKHTHTNHGSPRISEESIEATHYEVKECTAETSVAANKCHEKPHTSPSAKNTTCEHGAHISTNKSKVASPVLKCPAVGNPKVKHVSPEPFSLGTERPALWKTPPPVPEMAHCGLMCSRNVSSLGSPIAHSLCSPSVTKSPQPKSPLMSKKVLQFENKNHHDEEDNFSLASSTATSVRTNRSRLTVASAPTFRSSDRAERRKQYYMKIEEKHQALEAEKKQCEARTKEEQEAALRQLRKNMVVRANPVPTFYQEGPPPKVELKKLPLTRPKSPNLSRRKSCSDAVNSCQKEKGSECSRSCRHSIGNSPMSTTTKAKVPINGKNYNGACKVKVRYNPEKEVSQNIHV